VRTFEVKNLRSGIKMRRIIAILLLFVVGLEAIDLQCRFKYDYWGLLDGPACWTSNVNITSRQIITSVNGQSNFNGLDYNLMQISNQSVTFIPESLEKFFPNIEGLSITWSNLTKLEKKDMQQFPNLKILFLSGNKLEFLPGDLFEGNLELQIFSLYNNPITHIGHNLVTPLKKLESAIFPKCSCVDEVYFDSNIPLLADDLKANCSEPTQEMIGEADE
jgi:Leucine-rich repeat (LRR) protein